MSTSQAFTLPDLIDNSQTFVGNNPVSRTERPEVPELSEDDLSLVCHMALV